MSHRSQSTWCFNFKQQFVADVESGKKRQTIRALRKDGRLPTVGDTVKCYTGLRTKQTRLLNTGDVIHVARICLVFDTSMVFLNGCALKDDEAATFATDDGFRDATNMMWWFKSQYGGQQFEGFCTVWNPTGEVRST